MKIYIPTLGRIERQITLRQIPDEWKERVFIVCPKNEKHNWKNILFLPEKVVGSITKTKQWIFENTDERYIGIIDDDVVFYIRDKKIKTRRYVCTKEQVSDLFNMFEKWLKSGDVFCGTSNTFRSHENPKEYFYGKPSHLCFLDLDFLRKKNINFVVDGLEYFEDFHIPICILENGKRLHYTGEYITKEYKPNASGGCSINRTDEKNRNAMIRLAELHKPYITLKEVEGAKNQTLVVNLKMRIAFKKLFEEKVNGKED